MVDRVGFEVEGLSVVVRKLQALGLDVDDLKDAFSRIASVGAVSAARHSRKRSGRLAGSVRGNRAKSKAVVSAGGASVPYAGVQNYGWPARNIVGTQFMQAADRELQPRAVDLLEDEINQKIREKGLQ